MSFLIFAESLFFIVASVAIIIVGTLIGIVSWRLLRTLKNIEDISAHLKEATRETTRGIHTVFEHISTQPWLSFFMKRAARKKQKAAKKKSSSDSSRSGDEFSQSADSL